MSKVPCISCGVAILAETAARNGGKCVPCKSGTRERIESSRKRYRERRERKGTDPLRKLWDDLVDRVHRTPNGFASLSEAERQYFAVGLLEGEVYNGGFHQYFFNSSGDSYPYAIEGLEAIGAPQALLLLRKAKQILFGFADPPRDTKQRRVVLRSVEESCQERLSALDSLFWKDPDSLVAKLQQFAKERGLCCV